jgi:hypothetical protein
MKHDHCNTLEEQAKWAVKQPLSNFKVLQRLTIKPEAKKTTSTRMRSLHYRSEINQLFYPKVKVVDDPYPGGRIR